MNDPTGNDRARSFPWGFHTHGDEALKALLARVGRYAAALPDAGWLTLCGVSGCGKSHLARKLMAFWRRHHVWGASRRIRYPYFARWVTVMRRLREGDRGLVDHISGVSFLVIDDFGAEAKGTSHRAEASREAFLEVLDRRAGKPTVITVNLEFRQLIEIDQRISSRLTRNGGVVETGAGDYGKRPDRRAPEGSVRGKGQGVRGEVEGGDEEISKGFAELKSKLKSVGTTTKAERRGNPRTNNEARRQLAEAVARAEGRMAQ